MRERQALMSSVAIIGALAATSGVMLPATSADAWQSPTKHRYMNKSLQICDQGAFYVGGAPKVTAFGGGPTPGAYSQIIVGDMYVEFQTPMVAKSWPLIMVHGSGYSGSCVVATAGGHESWRDYTVRHGIPTYVVDQAGRARSGFDKSVIHEGEFLIDSNPAAAHALIPTLGGFHSTNWEAFYGHTVPAGTDITTGQMVRHGAPALQSNGVPAPGQDPLCATEPAHCTFLGRIPMEPEAPWAVDQAIASRTGAGAPAGLGTVKPDVGGHVNPAFPMNDRYLALEAYKFAVPNTESTLPGSVCPTCSNQNLTGANTWTPRALAELVEGLGGAIVATHSQSGLMGHHMVRILREHGKLNQLKGLISVEPVSCDFAASGLTGADFNNIPYMVLKGDYTSNLLGSCQASVDAIKAAGGNAQLIELDQPGPWQGSYTGPFGAGYVGPFKGVGHMMMIEDNPSPTGQATNLQAMDVILDWADKNISKPQATACADDGAANGGGTGAPGNGKGQGAQNNNPNGRF